MAGKTASEGPASWPKGFCEEVGADQDEVDEEGPPEFQVHLHYMVREPMAPPTTEPKCRPKRDWPLKRSSSDLSDSNVKRQLFPETEKSLVEVPDKEDTPKNSQEGGAGGTQLEVSDDEETPSKKKQSFKGTLKD